MELKKSPKANLESMRKIFFELGLVISLLICLYGFRMSSAVKPIETFGPLDSHPVEDQIIPITRMEEKQPPAPLPKVVDILLIADNHTEITEELDIVDSQADSRTAIHAAMQLDNNKKVEADEATVFIAPEEMPEFPGGNTALLHYLNKHIKYPAIAAENGVYGSVTVSFVVNKDGSVSDAKILRGVDPALDKEALRVVYSLPKWKPGKQSGMPVRVSFSVPIHFVLQH